MSEIGSKKLCFVIGPIGKAGSAERKHADMLLNLIVRDVMQQPEFDYQVRRADEDADPGMINDRVITDILNADLVVADLTGNNPNAYYELGIRHLAVKPTIHITAAGTALPFDTHGHRTIFVDLGDWESITSVRLQLANHVRTIQSAGYRVSNPITQARATIQIKESADPRDKVIAELQERVSAIELVNRTPENLLSEGNTTDPGRYTGSDLYELGQSIRQNNIPAAAVIYQRMFPRQPFDEAIKLASAAKRGDWITAMEIHHKVGGSKSRALQFIVDLQKQI